MANKILVIDDTKVDLTEKKSSQANNATQYMTPAQIASAAGLPKINYIGVTQSGTDTPVVTLYSSTTSNTFTALYDGLGKAIQIVCTEQNLNLQNSIINGFGLDWRDGANVTTVHVLDDIGGTQYKVVIYPTQVSGDNWKIWIQFLNSSNVAVVPSTLLGTDPYKLLIIS